MDSSGHLLEVLNSLGGLKEIDASKELILG
jgi:hypothetical protein